MAHEHADHWEGDINEAVIEDWKAETTPFERVQSVVKSTYHPQYAREIGERARVSEPTTRKHLKRLAATGHAEAVETSQGMQYKRSPQAIAIERINELHRELSREELADGIKRLRERINDLQERYDAVGPDDLVLQLEDGTDEDAWKAVTEWRSIEEDLDIANAALALYDFDPDTESDGQMKQSTNREQGAFAHQATNSSDSSIPETV